MLRLWFSLCGSARGFVYIRMTAWLFLFVFFGDWHEDEQDVEDNYAGALRDHFYSRWPRSNNNKRKRKFRRVEDACARPFTVEKRTDSV